MTETIITTVGRTILAYFLLLFLARVTGRKMISQMTFFDFVIGVTVGSVTASIALVSSNSSPSGITVLITLAILTLIVDYAHIKSLFIRKLTESEPVVVIRNGEIVEKNLLLIPLTLNELMALLREKNVFNIADVEFAIMEINGKISVLKKSQKQPLTPADLNIATSYDGLTKEIIIDGEIMHENLKDVQLDDKWLMDQLNSRGINDSHEVFFGALDTKGNLYISKRRNEGEKHGKYGIE